MSEYGHQEVHPDTDEQERARREVERFVQDPDAFLRELDNVPEPMVPVVPSKLEAVKEATKEKLVEITAPENRRKLVPGRRFAIVSSVVASLFALVGFGVIALSQQSGEISSRPLAPVAAEDGVVSERQQIYEGLAPWSESLLVDGEEVPASAESIVWLNSDATLQTSQVEVADGSVRWRASEPFYVSNLTVGDQLVSLTINNRNYLVHIGQPFIFEDQPTTMYMFSSETGTFLAAEAANVPN